MKERKRDQAFQMRRNVMPGDGAKGEKTEEGTHDGDRRRKAEISDKGDKDDTLIRRWCVYRGEVPAVYENNCNDIERHEKGHTD